MLWFGVDKFIGWRIAMVVPGIALILMGTTYYFLPQDTLGGNYSDLRHTCTSRCEAGRISFSAEAGICRVGLIHVDMKDVQY